LFLTYAQIATSMGQLTESDIFECLSTNFRLAAEDCEKLARSPRRGQTYAALRDKLELLEGACRQASVWRQDTRWLAIGMAMAEAHKRAHGWLMGVKINGGPRIKIADGHMHPLFVKLAENLRLAHRKAEEIRTKATGKVGMILPTPGRAPRRDTVPVGWRRPSGIIVPAEFA
jgi:hypothetical protein